MGYRMPTRTGFCQVNAGSLKDAHKWILAANGSANPDDSSTAAAGIRPPRQQNSVLQGTGTNGNGQGNGTGIAPTAKDAERIAPGLVPGNWNAA